MISTKNQLLFLCFLFYYASDLSAQISNEERKIAAHVDTRTPAALELLKKVVNINSGTMNFEGVRKVGYIFMDELKALGFETRWSPGDKFNRAGHLIAVHNGKKGPRILLIGHLDTVFELDNPFQEYKMLNDSMMSGPGVSDMKGGDVIIILAMQALKDVRALDDLTLEIVMTGDEELSGDPLELSKKDIMEAAKRADIALGYENGDGLSTTAVISRRGSSDWILNVKGNASHSSQIFTDKVGAGAIYEASRILNVFYSTLSKEDNLTFNPGVILGGSAISFDTLKNTGTAFGKNNVVAKDVMVRGDLRSVSKEQLEKARRIMTNIASENYPMTSADISFGEGYPPIALTDENKKLLSYYNKVSLDLGYGPEVASDPRKAGAADISFAAGYVDMAMDGIGLPGSAGHTIEEKGNIKYLSIEAKRSAILIYRFANGKID